MSATSATESAPRAGAPWSFAAHRRLWRRAFSFSHAGARLLRSSLRLRLGAKLMAGTMNAFYGFKGVTGNLPVDMATQVDADATLVRAPTDRRSAESTSRAPAKTTGGGPRDRIGA